jgi:general secretion pathway protein D
VKQQDAGPVDAVDLTFTCYSVERDVARDLLVESGSMTAPWEKVKKLLAEKKARLEHVSTIKTLSGQRAVTEEIHEFRYLSEYAAEHRRESTEHTERTVTNRVGEKPAAPKPDTASTSTETITTTRTNADAEIVPGLPSAFETRNVGFTVEVEPVVGPDLMTVDINCAVQSVVLAGNLKVTGSAAHSPEQPVFQSSRITTSISLPLEQPVWLSTLNPPGADGVNDRTDTGRTYLLFVEATLGEP